MTWLKDHAEMDASMEDALRMARVDGASLHALTPNNLYKAIRKHWLHPEKKPIVSEDLLQETAMLSFHYGAPPPTPENTQKALNWISEVKRDHENSMKQPSSLPEDSPKKE